MPPVREKAGRAGSAGPGAGGQTGGTQRAKNGHKGRQVLPQKCRKNQGLLPLAKNLMLTDDISVNAITGSTGAGVKPGATSHFSWRNNNISVYKAFEHQHVPEIKQSLQQLQNSFDSDIDFIPYRGDFPRGIFATLVVKTKVALEEIVRMYEEYYAKDSFVHIVDKNIDLKQVVNTNKCLIHLEKHGDKLLIISCIDNLLKGASGQAVHNMNLMFNLEETVGLRLKPSAF